MRQVLWPKYLLGGFLQRAGGIGGAERGEANNSSLGGIAGRWPDADVVLQGGMSEGLRDWDLWQAGRSSIKRNPLTSFSGVHSFSVFS